LSDTDEPPRAGTPGTEPPSQDAPAPTADVRTFLIADVRGYTKYTREHGDEAAAELASTFAELVREVVEARQGSLLELRGDEALVVFVSAREALRAAIDLQSRFDEAKLPGESESGWTPARPCRSARGIVGGR
jgi:class 3 adenylate cyclase